MSPLCKTQFWAFKVDLQKSEFYRLKKIKSNLLIYPQRYLQSGILILSKQLETWTWTLVFSRFCWSPGERTISCSLTAYRSVTFRDMKGFGCKSYSTFCRFYLTDMSTLTSDLWVVAEVFFYLEALYTKNQLLLNCSGKLLALFMILLLICTHLVPWWKKKFFTS